MHEGVGDLSRVEEGLGGNAKRGGRLGWVIGGLIVLGLFAWGAVRVRAALETKKALADERAAAVAKAQKEVAAGGDGRVEVVRGQAVRHAPAVELDGSLAARREADLAFKTGGRLASVRVKLGDCVRTGATLASLDAVEAAAQVRAVEAQVAAAEAQLALADDSKSRTGSLVATGAAPASAKVQTESQDKLAAAQLAGARAQAELARQSLANHTLTAPFAGCLTKVPTGIGAIVAPGQALFHLSDTAALRLQGTVRDDEAVLLKPGARVELADGESGTITAVLGAVDAVTRRVPVEAEVDNGGPVRKLAGTFVRAHVVGLPEVDVVRLPASALRPGSQDELFVVEDQRLEARQAAFWRAADGSLLVRRGVGADEQVLLHPSAETRGGQVVTQVIEVRSEEAAPSARAK